MMKTFGKFSLLFLAIFCLNFSALSQKSNRKEDKKNLRTIAEKEAKVKDIKGVFNRFGQDLPFMSIRQGRVGIRSVEIKSPKISSWEISMIRSFFEESLSNSLFDYVEIPEFEKRLVSSIYSTDTTFRLVNRDPSIEYRYNFDSVQSVVRKYRIDQYVALRIDYDDFFGYIIGVTFYDAKTISSQWSKTYISNERGLGSPSPFTRTDIAMVFLNNTTVKLLTQAGGVDSASFSGVNFIAGDLEYSWQQSSSMKNTFMIGFHGGVRYVYGVIPGVQNAATIISPRTGLDVYLGFLPKGMGFNSKNWISVKLSADANIRLNQGVFVNSSTNIYAYPTDNFGIFLKLEYNPQGTYLGKNTQIQLNTLNLGLGINVNL
ncbi:MAG: Uncharacterised protein [Owenweeksia sp. TMED14]|nr:MAG: Uncharacterised protein [Owenweeksia sp. TMED14]